MRGGWRYPVLIRVHTIANTSLLTQRSAAWYPTLPHTIMHQPAPSRNTRHEAHSSFSEPERMCGIWRHPVFMQIDAASTASPFVAERRLQLATALNSKYSKAINTALAEKRLRQSRRTPQRLIPFEPLPQYRLRELQASPRVREAVIAAAPTEAT